MAHYLGLRSWNQPSKLAIKVNTGLKKKYIFKFIVSKSKSHCLKQPRQIYFNCLFCNKLVLLKLKKNTLAYFEIYFPYPPALNGFGRTKVSSVSIFSVSTGFVINSSVLVSTDPLGLIPLAWLFDSLGFTISSSPSKSSEPVRIAPCKSQIQPMLWMTLNAMF